MPSPLTETSCTPAAVEPPAPSAAPPDRPVKKIVGWLALGLACLLGGLAVWLWLYPDQPGPARGETVTVEIPPGTGLVGIKEILARAGVIRDDFRFLLLAKRLGASRRLKAGEYAFPPGLSARAVLLELASGKTVQHAITLPEGSNLLQAADIIQAGGWGSRDEVLRLAAAPDFINGLGVQSASLEGYLFPDTYFFEKRTGLRPIVAAMVKRMTQVLAEEEAKRQGAAPGAPSTPDGPPSQAEAPTLSRHEALILASIIEKETALTAERPLVAKVFLNRLRTGMKLQADPTVIYGLAKFDAPLTRDDLDTPTPYNTYTNRGLPAGPICNPGRTAISAALNPALEDYYYFVSQNDGTHYFSKTLPEHNQAVARYRKKRLSNRQ